MKLSKAVACVVSYGYTKKGVKTSIMDRIDTVAKWMGTFVMEISKQAGIGMHRVTLSGFAVGGHVAGMLGRKLHQLSQKKVHAISGTSFNEIYSISE